jgi:hypothetical protein
LEIENLGTKKVKSMHFVLDPEVLNATEDASANVNRLTHQIFSSFYLVQCTSTL